MGKRQLAVSLIKLNLELGAGIPVRHFLQAFLLDPSGVRNVEHFNLRYPGSNDRADTGEFVVSAVGDLDGDGRSEFVCAVSLEPRKCYLVAYRHDGSTWRALPIGTDFRSVDLIRSIALGDLDADGGDEIVIGTRPSGAILVLRRTPEGFRGSTVDRNQYGRGTTNTREVIVANLGSKGEILAATARAGSEKWHATPGAIFLYRRSQDKWDRILIDDHGGRTHTRMIAIADTKDDGIRRIISCAVGVVQPESGRVDPQPELRAYRMGGHRAECEPIDTLQNMIKSRSFAAGDIDGEGRTALVVGTRALGTAGLETTCLFIYRFNRRAQTWEKETLDTSGTLGFHCVALADVDGDGRSEIIASDDGRGLIKLYKKTSAGWEQKTIYDAGGVIFCSAIHLIETDH